MTPDTETTTSRADGVVEHDGDQRVLRFERSLAHPVDRVWAALTEPDEIRGWLADADIDLAEGGRVQLRWLNTDEAGNRAVATGTVAALDPPRLLELDTDRHGVIRWELRPDGDGTRLTLTVMPPWSDDTVLLALAGWHIHLEHLADALAGRPVDWPRWSEDHLPRWKELHAEYVAQTS